MVSVHIGRYIPQKATIGYTSLVTDFTVSHRTWFTTDESWH